MEIIIGIFIFIFGSILGSFLNVCIYRIPKEESIAFPPSHCGSCGENLKWNDLFPIFSYIFLGGKCRYCKSKVSIQYPLVEAFTGMLFVILYLKVGFSIELLKFMFFTLILIVIGIIDFKTQDVYTNTIITGSIFGLIFLGITTFLEKGVNLNTIVPYLVFVIAIVLMGFANIKFGEDEENGEKKILLAVILIGIIYIGLDYMLGFEVGFTNIMLGVLIPTIIIGLIAAAGAMGWGDAEIIFMCGLFLNFKLSMVNLFLSIVIGGIVAIIFMLNKKKKGKDTMAFGPYIAIGAYLTTIVGAEVLNWYLNTFF